MVARADVQVLRRFESDELLRWKAWAQFCHGDALIISPVSRRYDPSRNGHYNGLLNMAAFPLVLSLVSNNRNYSARHRNAPNF